MENTYLNPLRHLHDQAEAEYQAYGPIEIVSTFGQPQAEYAAIRKACGMMDLPQRAIIELTGKDRASFVNNLLTNQTFDKQAKTSLEAGRVVYAFLLNTKGRVTLDANVMELGDRMWLEIDARLVEQALAALDRYLFADQVKLASRAEDLHVMALHGPGAESVLREASGGVMEGLEPMRAVQAGMFGRPAVVWRDDHCTVPGYHVAVDRGDAVVLWTNFQANFGAINDEPGQRRLRAVGWAAYNACRVEGGRALFGIDFDESVLPAETGLLERAVSFTKGCYVGQEIVARMHARGQLARKLVGIRMESDALPIAGAKVYDAEGNEVGGITSSTLSPVLSNTALCLGYVRKPLYADGTELRIPAEGAMRMGVVTALPFV